MGNSPGCQRQYHVPRPIHRGPNSKCGMTCIPDEGYDWEMLEMSINLVSKSVDCEKTTCSMIRGLVCWIVCSCWGCIKTMTYLDCMSNWHDLSLIFMEGNCFQKTISNGDYSLLQSTKPLWRWEHLVENIAKSLLSYQINTLRIYYCMIKPRVRSPRHAH